MFVWNQRETIGQAVQSLRDPDPLLVVLLPATVLGNMVLTAALLRALLSRFGRVGVLEMQALIAGAGLLNYLPMRPGLLGRVAYHRKYNNIRVADSIRVQLESVALGGLAVAWAVIALLIGRIDPVLLYSALALPVPVLFGAASRRPWRVWSIAGLLRYLDLLVTGARYLIAFELLDLSLRYESALLLAGISLATTLIPFLSNGLGLREWLVTLAAPLLEPAVIQQAALGTTGDLLNRAAELFIVTTFGLIAIAWLFPRLRPAKPPATEETPPL